MLGEHPALIVCDASDAVEHGCLDDHPADCCFLFVVVCGSSSISVRQTFLDQTCIVLEFRAMTHYDRRYRHVGP